jgi:hypothetical protein
VIALLYLSTSFLWWQAVAGIIGGKSRNGEQGDAGDYAAEDIWLFRSLVAASIYGHSRPIPHESASHARGYAHALRLYNGVSATPICRS